MKLLRSFLYAIKGIGDCIRLERNFRIHITAVITVLIFSAMYGLPKDDYIPIIIVMALVMAAEAVNTSIENIVDLVCKEKTKLAEIAKDTAAAAVFILAIGSVGVAVLTFSDVQKLLSVIERFKNPYMLVGLAAYIAIFSVFVFRDKSAVHKQNINERGKYR